MAHPSGRGNGAHRLRLPATSLSQAWLIGLAGALVVLAAGVLIVRMESRTHGTASNALTGGSAASTVPARSTVLEVRSVGNSAALVLRPTPGPGKPVAGTFSELQVTPRERLVTRDGRRIHPTSVQPGDTLLRGKGKSIEDRSQMSISRDGIVGVAPDPDGDTMVVQFGKAGSVVVDVTSGTRVTSAVHGSARSVIMDSDQVHVSGVLDTVVGEMTQTDAIVRLGPARHGPSSAGKAHSA